MCNFDQSCICVFGCIWVDEWIVDVMSFEKIFGLCGLKGHIMEIRRDVNGRTYGRNVKIELEFWKQNSQLKDDFKLNRPFCNVY